MTWCWNGGEAAAIRGAILAGGGATRFGGRPKGLERVGGVRVLDRLVELFESTLGELPLLISDAPDAARWRPGLRVVPDSRPGFGTLGGIYTAILRAPGPVLLAAWDMPFLTVPLLRSIADGLDEYDVFLPESGGRRGVEPLCAAYAPSCAAAVAAALDRGDLRAVAFHQDVKTGILPLERVRSLGDPARLFFNLNSPDDLAEANALWRHGSSRS